MVQNESLLSRYASLFSPLCGTYPTFLLDEELRIRETDPAVPTVGFARGDTLASCLSAEDRRRHEFCLGREPLSGFRPLGIPQNSVLCPLCGVPGWRYMLLEYAYTPRHALIRAVLYPSRRAYLTDVSHAERGAARGLSHLSRTVPSRSVTAGDLLRAEDQSEDAALLEERLRAACAAVQCFCTPVGDGSPPSLYALPSVLNVYRETVLCELGFVDCGIRLLPAEKTETFARLEPEKFFLLLSALFSVLNALSEDREIRVSARECGADHVLRFSTRCAAAGRAFLRTEDLQALAPLVPRKHFALSLAEYILGYSGYEAVLHADADSAQLSLTLCLPAERREREFKAPEDEETFLRTFAPVGRGFFALPDA